MLVLGSLGFTAPWLLLGLLSLPVLWFLLRAVPPAPIRRRFPGVALLLGLRDEDAEVARTPWWLLLLRMVAIAAAILAFAGPILNPHPHQPGQGPLLVLLDGTWADARDWPRRLQRAEDLLEEAGRDGRPVAVMRLTDEPAVPAFQAADAWIGRLGAMQPQPWSPADLSGFVAHLPAGDFDSYWLSDGLDHRGRAALTAALQARGTLQVFQSPRAIFALRPAVFNEGKLDLSALRLPAGDAMQIDVSARGPDPSGIDRELARATLTFVSSAREARGSMELPPELRNRINRFEILGLRSAAGVSLTDDSLKRRKVALISGREDREGLQLLSPAHYLRQALEPVADLIGGSIDDVLLAAPDVIVLADVGRLSQSQTDAMLDWIDKGGLLVRFAGPRMLAGDRAQLSGDPLMPVHLREGGRSVGGAMSWGDPKTLAPFAETSPFFGLTVPPEIEVREQVLAQPDPELPGRSIAALTDGTPLVTRKQLGQGQIVFFHVTANAEWSNLPLSGLFVQMLERLAVSTRPAQPEKGELTGKTWLPDLVLDAWGAPQDASGTAGLAGAALEEALTRGPGPGAPPGLYRGDDRRIAVNVIGSDSLLEPIRWPDSVAIEGAEARPERSLKGSVLTAALLVLLLDTLLTLALSGRLGAGRLRLGLKGPGRSGLGRGAGAVLLALALASPGVERLHAQQSAPVADLESDAKAIAATRGVVLAHVLTGDARVDDLAQAGLQGLGDRLWERTSIEPEPPMAVDIEGDELAFYPFLYWPVSTAQPLPSAAAYAKLNRYLHSGGMILFDTRDGDVAGFSTSASPEAKHLQRLAAGLDVPPLEPIPADHVLTRAFYLLQSFPGRFDAPALWVEAAPPDAEQAEGMPFRNLNDGVTPVVIGGNDWAGAWAVDEDGLPLLPVGRGAAGERQREIAYRFGINVVMHVLTGNYKSDQVHVPALLERLGQ
jgi:hypothetical protein